MPCPGWTKLAVSIALAHAGSAVALGCSTQLGADAGSGGTADGTGGTSTGGSGSGTGGTLASGGQPGVGGQPSSGGQTGTGGECGPCPGAACQAPVLFNVASDSASGQVNLADLTATGEGLSIECQATSGCHAECIGQTYLADGHYSFTLEATGALSTVVEFDIQNPTNCGCCGCCPGSYYDQLVLFPDPAADGSRACCADLEDDANNCGSCGEVCQSPMTCIAGNCLATP